MKSGIVSVIIVFWSLNGLATQCPTYEGMYYCPQLKAGEVEMPPYNIHVERKDENGVSTYTSWLSLNPDYTSVIVADGQPHMTKDHKGANRVYQAHCNDGALVNQYSSKKGTSETQIWLNEKGDLNIRYDFASQQILTCLRVN